MRINGVEAGRLREKQVSSCDDWKAPEGQTSILTLSFHGFLSRSHTDRAQRAWPEPLGSKDGTSAHSGPLTLSKGRRVQGTLLRNAGVGEEGLQGTLEVRSEFLISVKMQSAPPFSRGTGNAVVFRSLSESLWSWASHSPYVIPASAWAPWGPV